MSDKQEQVIVVKTDTKPKKSEPKRKNAKRKSPLAEIWSPSRYCKFSMLLDIS